MSNCRARLCDDRGVPAAGRKFGRTCRILNYVKVPYDTFY